MNGERNLADLIADKERISEEITRFVKKKVDYFLNEYGIDAYVDVCVKKEFTPNTDFYGLFVETNLDFKL